MYYQGKSIGFNQTTLAILVIAVDSGSRFIFVGIHTSLNMHVSPWTFG